MGLEESSGSLLLGFYCHLHLAVTLMLRTDFLTFTFYHTHMLHCLGSSPYGSRLQTSDDDLLI